MADKFQSDHLRYCLIVALPKSGSVLVITNQLYTMCDIDEEGDKVELLMCLFVLFLLVTVL